MNQNHEYTKNIEYTSHPRKQIPRLHPDIQQSMVQGHRDSPFLTYELRCIFLYLGVFAVSAILLWEKIAPNFEVII